MTRLLIAPLILFGLISSGCRQSATTAERTVSATSAPAPTAEVPSDASVLPPPKPAVSLQIKYLRAIPIRGASAPAYETVPQWVFQPSGEKDGTLICVGDGSHCIELQKLREQLNRPSDDPLGIRTRGK
jgi:hypothetical protein